jgi:hypothetical protein
MFQKALTCMLVAAVLAGENFSSNQRLFNNVQGDYQPAAAAQEISSSGMPAPTQTLVPTKTPTKASPTPAATKSTSQMQASVKTTPQAASVVGPDAFPEGVNPLTGLPVKDKDNLALSPALVSVTNFPVTARPQAGLSFSPFVYELYVGEGMTRFLAMFYGDYPVKGESSASGSGIALSDDRIGPIRSGRLPYESLRKLYNGFLVMASASSNVLPTLGGYTNIFGSDTSDINRAMIPATKLADIAAKNPSRLKPGALTGLEFDAQAPQNGTPAKAIWIPFSFLNQVFWRYDAASGGYLRYQDQADGKTFVQATDRLNGEALNYKNVVVLFADHRAHRETLIDVDLMYIDKMPALLFRDGKMYSIYWTTANDAYEKSTGQLRPIRFIDAQGNPFPLKPGQTWVEMVPSFTKYHETVDSETYFDLKTKPSPGSGVWSIDFYPPVPER